MGDDAIAAILAEFIGPWMNRVRATPIGGGFSGAAVWRIDADGQSAVLRRWPNRYPVERLARIHGFLTTRNAQRPPYLPSLIPTRQGGTTVQQCADCWDLCQWLPGEPDRAIEPNRLRLQAAIRALAASHCWLGVSTPKKGKSNTAFAHASAASPGLARRLAQWRRWGSWKPVEASLSEDPDRLGRRTLDLARRDAVWMNEIEKVAFRPVRLAVCWRDVHRQDVFFLGDAVSGIVDYGAMGIDTPATDLGRLMGSWIPSRPDLWLEFIADYDNDQDDPSPLAELAWLFHRTGSLLAAMHWREWLLVERRPFPDAAAAYSRWRSIVESLESLSDCARVV